DPDGFVPRRLAERRRQRRHEVGRERVALVGPVEREGEDGTGTGGLEHPGDRWTADGRGWVEDRTRRAALSTVPPPTPRRRTGRAATGLPAPRWPGRRVLVPSRAPDRVERPAAPRCLSPGAPPPAAPPSARRTRASRRAA